MGSEPREQRLARLTPVRRRLLDRLLDQALDLEPGERGAFIERCCGRAPRIGAWLKRLLAASTEPTGFIDQSARHMVGDALEQRTRPTGRTLPSGTRLGPWRLVEPVGAGGMGEVYRAERADGSFEMQVAVKLIRSHSKDLAELLAAERQTMARLNHAAIARLLDGGVTEDGRPYLVMDWVEGPTLDEWFHDRNPSPEECLRVFGEACEAVAAAHRELIVHGDIKPSNLVVRPDGGVCLLDFGVARLLDREGGETMPAALTPGFGAPEQFAGRPASTVTDIYALGALLHWMVYGTVPGRSSGRPLDPWQSSQRGKDIAAVTARATQDDPDRRYATVNALLLELRRLRGDFPVKARKPGPLERAGMWSRRHRVGAVLGAVALVSVIGGISAVLWQARVAAVERDLARAEAARSNAVREHLTLLFREVGSLAEDAEDLTARELLDRTAEVAGEWLADEPDIQQQVQVVLGEIMIALNDYAAAEPLLADFVDHDHGHASELLRSIAYIDMAQVHHRKGRVQQGFEAADRAVAMLDAFPGAHPARMSDALQVRGRLHRDLGRWDEALADLRRARELALEVSSGPRPLMARAENNLATTLLIGGRLEQAAVHLEAAEALWLALGRADSSDALAVMGNLASVLDRLGRSDEAVQRLRQVIEIRREKYGESGAMAAARLSLGRLLVVRGAIDEAGRHLEQARQTFARFVGEDTPDFAASLHGLGELARARGDLERARELFSRSAEIMAGLLGESHPYSLQTRLARVDVERKLDPGIDAAVYDELIVQARDVGGAAQTVLSAALCDRARFDLERGLHADGRAAAEECLQVRRSLGLGGWRITEAEALISLADTFADDKSGESGLKGLLAALGEQMHPDHPRVAWFGETIGETPSSP